MDFKGGVGKFPYAHNWEGGTKHGGRGGNVQKMLACGTN